MNSYHEFMLMKSDSWIQIWYKEFIYLNSYANELYKNSEFIHLNSYTWIHKLMNSYIHFTYEFTCIWFHIIISYMNSCNDFMKSYVMNSYVYEFTYMNSYMNSYKLWIHMIFSYMNSYVSWIHTWIRVYQGSTVPDELVSTSIKLVVSLKCQKVTFLSDSPRKMAVWLSLAQS